MSTTTTTKAKATSKPKAAAKAKRRKASSTTEQRLLAAMANAKGKPAAKISGPNIAKVQRAVKPQSPAEYLGISTNQLTELAKGNKRPAQLKTEPAAAFRKLSAKLGGDTYYGRKLAAMLWAVQQGVPISK